MMMSERQQVLMKIHNYITKGGKNVIKEYLGSLPKNEMKAGYRIRHEIILSGTEALKQRGGIMPFLQVDPVKEAQELQEIFKDDPEAKEAFRKYEIAHIESARLMREEMRLRNDLAEMRKLSNITQTALQQASGLSQQAISRIEVGKDVSPSLKSLIKYVDAIGCQLKLELKEDQAEYALKTNECVKLNGANMRKKNEDEPSE